MSERAFVTRAEAAAPDRHLVRIMASAHHEADRFAGCQRPEFEKTFPEWQDSACRAMAAALLAAEAAGYRITRA
jgi:hypothetical protein